MAAAHSVTFGHTRVDSTTLPGIPVDPLTGRVAPTYLNHVEEETVTASLGLADGQTATHSGRGAVTVSRDFTDGITRTVVQTEEWLIQHNRPLARQTLSTSLSTSVDGVTNYTVGRLRYDFDPATNHITAVDDRPVSRSGRQRRNCRLRSCRRPGPWSSAARIPACRNEYPPLESLGRPG